MQTATITGEWASNEVPAAGGWAVDFTAAANSTAARVGLTDTEGNVMHPAVVWDSGRLVDGVLTATVPVGDDPDLRERGWLVRVTVAFDSGPRVYFYLSTEGLSGETVDIVDLIAPADYPGESGVLIRGVPGGIAGLDSDGDVVDADGVKVIDASVAAVDAAGYATDADLTAAVAAAVAGVIASAPGALDTLDELAAALGDDANFAATITTALAAKATTAALTAHTGDTANPHAVTKAQVGLGNADNTSDATKLATVAQLKVWARSPDLLIAGAVTRDSNGAATSAPVVWPDATPGTYTATTVSTAFPGAVDAYTITYGSPVTKTYTQPTVTRDANGAATTVPAITVA